MEAQSTSYIAYDMHPCYKIYNVSYILISTPSALCVLLYVFLGSLSLVTVCGNLLVIISIVYFKQLHTPTNYLVLSLAVADLLVGVLVFPSSMAFSLSSCLFEESFFCKVRDSVDITLCTSSIMNLCCISIDRYFAVCQPLTYKVKMNHDVAVIMILVSWAVSVITGNCFTFARLETCESCSLFIALTNSLGYIVAFYLPVIVMLCIYLKIFLVAQRQVRTIQSTKSGATVSRMERKATKTLATVMGVFLLCWFPFFFSVTFLSFLISVSLPVIETLNWFVLSNSTLNPFIYALFYTWFKSSFKIIISGRIFQGDLTNSKLG